jgi:multidrug efflux pump subunit AcrB
VLDAAKEVGRPTFFGVLIITIVYMPILSLTGIEGKMFKPMALTVMMALVGALILSLTLMPVLCSFFLRGKISGGGQRAHSALRSRLPPDPALGASPALGSGRWRGGPLRLAVTIFHRSWARSSCRSSTKVRSPPS